VPPENLVQGSGLLILPEFESRLMSVDFGAESNHRARSHRVTFAH
jgi:hypothetical protein